MELRLRNYTEEGLPFSSKELRECYRQGGAAFGWAKRNEPRSMRDGHELIGWGMATGTWEAYQQQSGAKAVLSLDGKLEVSVATATWRSRKGIRATRIPRFSRKCASRASPMRSRLDES